MVWREIGGGGSGFQPVLPAAKGKQAIWELTQWELPVYSGLGSCDWDAVSPLQLFEVLSRFVSIAVPCSPEDSILGLETLLGDPGWLSVGQSDRSRDGVGIDCRSRLGFSVLSKCPQASLDTAGSSLGFRSPLIAAKTQAES